MMMHVNNHHINNQLIFRTTQFVIVNKGDNGMSFFLPPAKRESDQAGKRTILF